VYEGCRRKDRFPGVSLLRARYECIAFATATTGSECVKPNWQELRRMNTFLARAAGTEALGIEN